MNMCPYIYVGLPSTMVVNSSEFLDRVLKLLCKENNVLEQDVFSRSRKKELVMVRHQFFFIAGMKTKLSLSHLGKVFKRDHATVLHSKRTFQNLLDTDAKLRIEHLKIMEQLRFKVN